MVRRPFDPRSDFTAIGEFLTGLYLPGNRDGNWLSPVWEYAYTHPWFDDGSTSRIGVWEDEGRIVGVVTCELRVTARSSQQREGSGQPMGSEHAYPSQFGEARLSRGPFAVSRMLRRRA